MPSRDSLAGRLFWSAALWSIAILLMSGLVLSALHRRYAEQSFDERLDIYLRALVVDVVGVGDSEKGSLGNLGEPRFNEPLSGWYWQVTRLGPDNVEALDIKTSKSLFAGRLPISGEAGGAKPVARGREATATGTDDRPLRLVERYIDASAPDQTDERYIVSVAGDPAEIRDEARRFNLALAITFVLLALALLASTFFQVQYGLRPLIVLSTQVGAIRRGEADHIDGHYPNEIAPLADELNQLVTANKEIVERARTQVGNLAHALKTPLSVIMNEADDVHSPLASKVQEQAAIMRGQVQYYLDRARAATRAVLIGASCDVEATLKRLVRAFEKIYRDRDIAFDTTIAHGLVFRGEQQDLEDMAGNLADNAGKWAAGTVSIAAHALPMPGGARPMLEIIITDDGPGLPAEARAEAVRRGRRLDESRPGSGLGLNIVNDLATLYGGSLSLEDNPGGGLLCRLRLPAIERG